MNTRSRNRTGIEPVAAGNARPGREVVVEEEGRNEEVKGTHGDGGVLVREPRRRRPSSPVRLRVHPVVGAAVELAGGEGNRRGDEVSAQQKQTHLAVYVFILV